MRALHRAGSSFFLFLRDPAVRGQRSDGSGCAGFGDRRGADGPPCSGPGLRTGSQLCSCVGRWRSTPATSAAGEEGEDEAGQRTHPSQFRIRLDYSDAVITGNEEHTHLITQECDQHVNTFCFDLPLSCTFDFNPRMLNFPNAGES